MNRRSFVASTLAIAAVPGLSLAGAGEDGTPADVAQALANGETVFIDFYAKWCSTCARQERVIETILRDEPAYRESVRFFALDWDRHQSSDLAKSLNIPRRSTLVVLKGDREYGRIVAGTSHAQIKDLMDIAVQVAAEA